LISFSWRCPRLSKTIDAKTFMTVAVVGVPKSSGQVGFSDKNHKNETSRINYSDMSSQGL
jgi:hypothetical protein